MISPETQADIDRRLADAPPFTEEQKDLIRRVFAGVFS